MQLVNVFDLDCTLIDSSHRINESGNPKDGLDLDYWIDNSIPEKIMKDKLLPLVEVFHEFRKSNFTNIAVTAREMTGGDYDFLEHHGLHFDMILHREDSKELDHVLKEKRLDKLFVETDLKPFLAFDDKEENLKIFRKFGFTCINAININSVLGSENAECSQEYQKARENKG